MEEYDYLDPTPITIASYKEKNRVLPPDEVQWLVDDDGLETVEGDYFIALDRIDQLRSETGLYDWPLHMAEKGWVRIDHFFVAFIKALDALSAKKGTSVSLETLAETFRETLRIAASEKRRYRKRWDPKERGEV